jgi:ATP-dependent helicase/nuclease subunit B
VPNVFIHNLAQACREHLTDEKLLLAPTRRVAHEWLEQVTRCGAPVVNVRVDTVRSIARRILAEPLGSGAQRIATPADLRITIATAWKRAMGDGQYLSATRVTPRLLTLAERTVMDLRQAGLTADALDPAQFEHHGKGCQLQALLAEYEAALKEGGLLDYADAMRQAVDELTPRDDRPQPLLLISQDQRFTVLERKLLDAYGPDHVRWLPCDQPADEHTATDVSTDRALLAWLGQPGDAPAPIGDDSVRIVHAVGPANEVRQALRGILTENIPLDQVELLYTAADPYARLIHETAQRILENDKRFDLGVPVTFADGLDAHTTRPGRLLSAWIAWVSEDFPQSTALQMLQSGLLGIPHGDDDEPVSRARLVRTFRSMRVGFGDHRYAPCFDKKITSLKRRIERGAENQGPQRDTDHLERHLESAVALRAMLAPLTETGIRTDSRPETVIDAAAELLSNHARIANKLDGLAQERLLQSVQAIGRALKVAPSDGADLDPWEWLGQLPQQLRVGGSRPRPGHLHAAALRSGGHSGRPHTIIIGLDDGRFPPTSLQDPLVLDGERARISSNVPRAADRLHETLDDFTRLLCRLRGRVTLGFSSRSIDDDREAFASPVVLSAFRILSDRRESDHTDLLDWLDVPGSFAPARAEASLDVGEWWLLRGAQTNAVTNLNVLMETAYPNLARGREATRNRMSDAFTVHDGLLQNPAPQLDPRHPDGPVVSATTKLHLLGRCPLAYFQNQLLGITPPEDVQIDPRRWLDPLQFGTLLHEVLYDFVGMLIKEESWPPDPQRDLERIAAIVDGHVARCRREVPEPNPEAYDRQRREIESAAEIFVHEQSPDRWKTVPRYLEASLGMRSQDTGTQIDTTEPVVIDLPDGRTIRARARIDRIDARAGDETRFILWDYKSSSYVKQYDPADCFDQGRLLQHVLYMAVAQRVLAEHFEGAKVEGFLYLFPGPRTRGREVLHSSDIVPEGTGVIDALCDLVGNGAFPASTTDEDCRYCDYRAACRAVEVDLKSYCQRSKRKVDNQANEGLAPFRKLRNGK